MGKKLAPESIRYSFYFILSRGVKITSKNQNALESFDFHPTQKRIRKEAGLKASVLSGLINLLHQLFTEKSFRNRPFFLFRNFLEVFQF